MVGLVESSRYYRLGRLLGPYNGTYCPTSPHSTESPSYELNFLKHGDLSLYDPQNLAWRLHGPNLAEVFLEMRKCLSFLT
jgi:hypothetical protein